MSFNPHPPLSAFPSVLATLIFLAEIGSFFFISQKDNLRRLAKALLAACLFISPITYYSGYWGAEMASKTFKISDELISYHQMFAKIYLITLVSCGLFALLEVFDPLKRKALRLAFSVMVVLNLVAAILVSRQGGILVFEHGAGVSAKLESALGSAPN
jgi:uncharacterized membrane protein